MRRRAVTVGMGIVVTLVACLAGSAFGAGPFVDIGGNTHATNINLIYTAGITSGCNADHYCPDNPVTRAQMATFLARIGGLGKNLPKAHAKSDRQTYCQMATDNPGAFPLGPCRKSDYVFKLTAGYDIDLLIGMDGFPSVSMYERFDQNLSWHHCTTVDCSEEDQVPTNVVDSRPNVGSYSSNALSRDGYPFVSYFDNTNEDLRIALCTDPFCDFGSSSTIDSVGDVGRFTSMAIGDDGRAVVSYYDKTNGDLKVAHCSNLLCDASTVHTVDDGSGGRGTPDNVGLQTSIAVGEDGFPVISYLNATDSALRVAHCVDTLCANTPNIRTIGAMDLDAHTTAITIGVDGFPVIAYKASDALKVAHCLDAACSAAPLISTVDGGGGDEAGLMPSMAIGSNGKPMLVYMDVTSTHAMFATCSTADCSGAAHITDLKYPLDDLKSSTSIALGLDRSPTLALSLSSGAIEIIRPEVEP